MQKAQIILRTAIVDFARIVLGKVLRSIRLACGKVLCASGDDSETVCKIDFVWLFQFSPQRNFQFSILRAPRVSLSLTELESKYGMEN